MLKKSVMTTTILVSFCIASDTSLSGYIGTIGGKIEYRDNFYYDNDNNKVTSLNNRASRIDKGIILPTFDISYDTFFIKTEIENDLLVKGGYSWETGNSIYLTQIGGGIEQTFENNLFYKLEYQSKKMYENPYLINQNRKDIDSDHVNISFGIKELYNFLDITYNGYYLNIDDKVSKNTQQSGYEHEISIMPYLFEFNRKSYGGLGIIIGTGTFDGKSNDYAKYGIVYGMEYLYQTHKIEFETSYLQYDFDLPNSYFNKKRNEKEVNFNLVYTKRDFFEYKNIFLKGIIFTEIIDSNINFFDKKVNSFAINIGYIF